MSDSDPLVSVILLSYNHSDYIGEALSAIENQTYTNLEVMVIDDCSVDDSVSKIEAWSNQTKINHVFIANKINLGICKTLNNTLQTCRGRYVSVIAADDWAEPSYISEMVECFSKQNDDVAFVYAGIKMVDIFGQPLIQTDTNFAHNNSSRPTARNIFLDLLRENFVNAPAVMYRRDYAILSGGYDETLIFEDYDMWLKLSSNYDALFLPKKLVNYRVIESSMSRSPSLFSSRKISELKILEKWVAISSVSDVIIAKRMRHLCLELLAIKESTFSIHYLGISNSLDYDPRWSFFTFLVRLKITRKTMFQISKAIS